MATAQELAAALSRFRESGKFTIAYADTLGESGAGNIAYYLASSFEEVLDAAARHAGPDRAEGGNAVRPGGVETISASIRNSPGAATTNPSRKCSPSGISRRPTGR